MAESVKRVVSGLGKQEATTAEDGTTTTAASKSGEQYMVSFKSVLLPLFETLTHLDLPQGDDLIG